MADSNLESPVPSPQEQAPDNGFNFEVFTEDQIRFLGRTILGAGNAVAGKAGNACGPVENELQREERALGWVEDMFVNSLRGYLRRDPAARLPFFMKLATGGDPKDATQAAGAADGLFDDYPDVVLSTLIDIHDRVDWHPADCEADDIYDEPSEPAYFALMNLRERLSPERQAWLDKRLP